MKMANYIEEALLNLFSSKLRSTLALLGILVGTASVVAMVCGGELATNEAIKQFKTLGTDLLAVSIANAPREGGKNVGIGNNLSLPEVNDLKNVDKNILGVAPYTQIYSLIYFNGNNLAGSILGVTQNFGKIIHVELNRGRFISNFDGYAYYCVIGKTIYEEIKKKTYKNPLGQQLQIGNNLFTIIGILEQWPENSFVYATIDNSIMIPLLTSIANNKYAMINNIIIKLLPGADIDTTKNHIQSFMNSILGDKQLFFRSAKELIQRMAKQSEILTIFLGLIGSVSLVVGGIGVMNIMLVSVIERRREIGVRLAVGAKRKDIRSLFLVEAIMLSLLGGVFGVIIGLLIAYIIALFSHWEFIVFWLPPLIGFSVSTAAGIFFGYYPAFKASKMDPIVALRTE